MSTAPSRLARRIDKLAAGALLALAALAAVVALPATATSADRNAPIKVRADHFKAAEKGGTTVLSGHVKITQGTLAANAAKATAYRDRAGNFNRIVLEGAPATIRQQMDGGATMRGHAAKIDYAIGGGRVVMTGKAHVERSDQGSFDGARLVYNTKTGAIEGEGGNGGQVELTLKPSHASTP